MAFQTGYVQASVLIASWLVFPLKKAVSLIYYIHQYLLSEGFRAGPYSQATQPEIYNILNPAVSVCLSSLSSLEEFVIYDNYLSSMSITMYTHTTHLVKTLVNDYIRDSAPSFV